MTGVDPCRRGWVPVTLEVSAPGLVRLFAVRVNGSLDGVLAGNAGVVGTDMPLGPLESGWRDADLVARGLLGIRRHRPHAAAA